MKLLPNPLRLRLQTKTERQRESKKRVSVGTHRESISREHRKLNGYLLLDIHHFLRVSSDSMKLTNNKYVQELINRGEEVLKGIDILLETKILTPEITAWLKLCQVYTMRKLQSIDSPSYFKLCDTMIELCSDFTAHVYSEKGAFLIGINDEDAEDLLTDAINLAPDYPFAYRYRGYLFLQLLKYDEALNDYNMAIKYDPEDHWTLLHRAIIHRILENVDQAFEDVNKAINLNYQSARCFAERAMLYIQTGKLNEARQDVDQALAIDPNSSNAQFANICLLRFKKKYDLCLTACESSRNEYRVRKEIIYCTVKSKNYKEAIRLIDSLMNESARAKREEWLYYLRGCCHFQLNNYENILEDFSKSFELCEKHKTKKMEDKFLYKVDVISMLKKKVVTLEGLGRYPLAEETYAQIRRYKKS